jgi:hypothetical protein
VPNMSLHRVILLDQCVLKDKRGAHAKINHTTNIKTSVFNVIRICSRFRAGLSERTLTRVLYVHFSSASSGQRGKRSFLHRLSTAIYAFELVSNVANSYLAYECQL